MQQSVSVGSFSIESSFQLEKREPVLGQGIVLEPVFLQQRQIGIIDAAVPVEVSHEGLIAWPAAIC